MLMDETKREKDIIRTSFIGIIGNFFLVSFKAFVGILAGSISIIMDAVNNFTDALSSIITIIGAKLSNKKPNKKHPYGYGRIEYLTSVLISMLILFAGCSAIYESIKSIISYHDDKELPTFKFYSIIIIASAILVKVLIGLFFRHKGKVNDSSALSASGVDALFDSILSTATLVGMVVAKYANLYVEGYLGIIIGLFILKSGIEVLKESLSSMIGDRFDREFINEIKKEINQVEGVKGCYDLILNSYGHNKNIGSIHIGVSDKLTAKEIQAIERKISTLMYDKYNTIMTIGIYAEDFSDEFTRDYHNKVLDIIKDYPQVLQLHGFYIDKNTKTLNCDLVISFDDDNPHNTIDIIKGQIKSIDSEYEVVINYDQDFSLS